MGKERQIGGKRWWATAIVAYTYGLAAVFALLG